MTVIKAEGELRVYHGDILAITLVQRGEVVSRTLAKALEPDLDPPSLTLYLAVTGAGTPMSDTLVGSDRIICPTEDSGILIRQTLTHRENPLFTTKYEKATPDEVKVFKARGGRFSYESP